MGSFPSEEMSTPLHPDMNGTVYTCRKMPKGQSATCSTVPHHLRDLYKEETAHPF